MQSHRTVRPDEVDSLGYLSLDGMVEELQDAVSAFSSDESEKEAQAVS